MPSPENHEAALDIIGRWRCGAVSTRVQGGEKLYSSSFPVPERHFLQLADMSI